MQIDILHTNDIHSNVENLPKASSYIQTIRNSNANTLLVDAGDMITGEFQFEYLKGKVESDIANYLNYDVVTIGNHDFDEGIDFLKEHMGRVNSQYVLSNMIDVNNQLGSYQDSYIIERDGIKIGFFSLILPYVQQILKDVPGLDFLTPEHYGNIVNKLKEDGADIIIALNHQGIERDIELAEMNLGVDIIIGAHSHTELEEPQVINNTLIVQTGCFAKNLGHLTVDYTNNKLTLVDYKLVHLDSYQQTDDKLQALIDNHLTDVNTLGTKVYGTTATDLDGRREVTTKRSTNLGALVCDSYLNHVNELGYDVDFAFINSRGIRQSVTKGEITKRDLYNVLPFGKKLIVSSITGQNLKTALSISTIEFQTTNLKVNRTPEEHQFYYIDESTPIEDERVYKFVTVDYLYDHELFPTLRTGELIKYDAGLDIEVLGNYIQNLEPNFEYYSNNMVTTHEEL